MKHIQKHNFIEKLVGSSRKDDGYVLLYALIVTAVLTALVLGVFGVSLSNLNAQQQAAADMQDRYKAEGYVEMVVVQMEVYLAGLSYIPLDASDNPAAYESEDDAKMAAQGQVPANLDKDIRNFVKNLEDGSDEFGVLVNKAEGEPLLDTEADDIHSGFDGLLTIPLTIQVGGTQIDTILQYDVLFSTEKDDDLSGYYTKTDAFGNVVLDVATGQPVQVMKYVYAGVPELQNRVYNAYTISQTAGNADD